MDYTPNALELLILILAAYRITRLIVLDTIFGEHSDEAKDYPLINEATGEPVIGPNDQPMFHRDRGTGIRAAIDRFAYDDVGEDRSAFRAWFGTLFSCPWCMGVWVSTGLYCLWYWGPAWIIAPLIPAAIAGAQGLLQSWERSEDE